MKHHNTEDSIKTEPTSNFLDDFHSDDSFIANDLYVPLSPEGLISDAQQAECSRRSRRKPSSPQKALQPGNISECSQDPLDAFGGFCGNYDDVKVERAGEGFMDVGEGEEEEDLLRDINEENIFNGIREEIDGESIDDESIVNAKEEWKANWGVKCNMCEKVFTYKAEYDRHYKESYNLPPVYTCTSCNKSLDKYTTFRSHCYRHSTEGRYKCKECSKGFSLQSMLQDHILSKHTKAKPFICDECGKSFVTKPGLKIHVKKHRSEIKEEYPCAQCGKVLHTRGGLTSHMNVHRLGRRFMCDVCGKTFTQKVNMQQHVRQHTGDKPHGCDKCGKTFAEKSHLARHYSFHSDERPFKCEVCQKMYKTERCLKVHSLVHVPDRPFICNYCNKGFLSSTKLKQHYNIHTGERPYKCKYCDRTFTNYPNWLKHTRRRHKVNHRTGEVLEPKLPKAESPPTPSPSVESQPSSTEGSTDPYLLEFGANCRSDVGCQQQQQLNSMSFSGFQFVNGGTFPVQYFQQSQIFDNDQSNLTLQFGDIPMQYLQQCD